MLFRGEYDKRRDKVAPMTPAALPTMNNSAAQESTGAGQVAPRSQGILSPARVTVNRYWQELFGDGPSQDRGRLRGNRGASQPPGAARLAGALDFQKDWNIKRFFKHAGHE